MEKLRKKKVYPKKETQKPSDMKKRNKGPKKIAYSNLKG